MNGLPKCSILVQRVRKSQAWTQTELAKRLGVSMRTVRRWEHGEGEPRGEQYRKLASMLEARS